MKKKLIVTTLAICLIAAGSLTVNAFQGGRGGCDQSGRSGYGTCGENTWCDNQPGQNRPERVSELLGLTEQQEEQIAAIRAEERTAIQLLREQKWESQEKMRELIDAGTSDEKTIRAIAEEKAKIQVEMAVARARMQSRIHEIMTPEQQELATKLRSERFDNRGNSRGGRGRW